MHFIRQTSLPCFHTLSSQREENFCRSPLFGADWPIRRDHTECCWHNLALWPTVSIGRVEVASGGNVEEENSHNEDNQRGYQRHQFLLNHLIERTTHVKIADISNVQIYLCFKVNQVSVKLFLKVNAASALWPFIP